MVVDTEQVIHFAWVTTPGPRAQAAVLGCEGVCRTEVRNTHVHRAQQASKFRKCLGCETWRKLSTFSRGQPPPSPWQVGSQGCHSKEARHLTGQYSLAKSECWVTVHGVAKSLAQLRDFTFTFFFYNITCVGVSPRFYPWPSLLKYLIHPSLTQLSQEICSYVQLIHICRPNSLPVLYPKLDLLSSIFPTCDWPET